MHVVEAARVDPQHAEDDVEAGGAELTVVVPFIDRVLAQALAEVS